MEQIKKITLLTIHSDAKVTSVGFTVNGYKIIGDECFLIIDGDTNVDVKNMTAGEFAKMRNKIYDKDPNQIEMNLGDKNG